MKNCNILITSVGKRVSLVRKFQKELKTLLPDSKVYSTDVNPLMAPAGIVSDGCYEVPKCTSENYIKSLLKICVEHKIGIVIPMIDTELAILSLNKQVFDNYHIVVLVSSCDFIASCRDKRKTTLFFQQHDIKIPSIRDKEHPVFPMFAKPYDGSLSTNLHIILTPEDLTNDIKNDPKLIFMEYIDKSDYKEFTVDLYYGRDNRVKSIVPRERLEIRAGEINKGITKKNYLLNYLKERIEYLPGVVGCICIQLFYRESDNDVIGIEINPRFGGGYPLSYCAGANFPLFIIKEYIQEETIEYCEDWKDNTIMLRYDDEVIIYDGDRKENNCCF